MLSSFALAALAVLTQDAKPTVDELVAQARQLLPTYTEDYKALLTAAERREVIAAAHVFDAALSLDSQNAYVLWWRAQCDALLGEDARNRGESERARERYTYALERYERATEIAPDYYWAHYGRGLAQSHFGTYWGALQDLDQAVETANSAVTAAGEGGNQDALFVRFKARQWRADTHMRTFAFDVARDEFRSFYADNGNNQWDLGYSLAETYQLERDFAGARATYAAILENPEFRAYDSTYQQLGYLAGLVGVGADGVTAAEWLQRSFEHELQPGLYPRMWLWMLADEARRAPAETDLRDFLENPPPELSEWDAQLGRFVLGETPREAFLEQVEAEHRRRLEAAEALDDLLCEAWFYVGFCAERDGDLTGAVDAYRRSLAFFPRQFKWEWAYARRYFAAACVDRAPAPGPTVTDDVLSGVVPRALIHPTGAVGGRVESFRWHRAGELAPVAGAPAADHVWRPGDFVQCVLVAEDGTRTAVQLVVDVSEP